MTGGTLAPSGVRGIDHIGITVPDMEVATRFLKEAFGAAVVYDTVVDGRPSRSPGDLAATVGLQAEQRIVATRIVRLGESANVELFQVGGAGTGVDGIGALGLQHFAVYCDDLEDVLARVVAAGGSPLRGPNPLFGAEAGPGNTMHYVRAPWGTLIELIAYPPATERGKDADRWRPPRQSR